MFHCIMVTHQVMGGVGFGVVPEGRGEEGGGGGRGGEEGGDVVIL